jgi:hypothetical protein
VNSCVQGVYRIFWGRNIQIEKEEFLLGKETGIVESNILYMLINMFIKYKIWKYKLAGVLPLAQNIANELKDWVNNLTAYGKWKNMLPLVRQHVLLL